MTDFNQLIRREIDKSLHDALSGIKNEALKQAIRDAAYEAAEAKLAKNLSSKIEDVVLESIKELTNDIKTSKTRRVQEANRSFSGGKDTNSGSKSTPTRPVPTRRYGGKDGGYGGK